MVDLKMEDAEMLVDQLTTIGHPMLHGARLATAMDLVEWCKGGVFGDRPWTPLQQATELVREARATFGNWERAGGTTAFQAMFVAKFRPPVKVTKNLTPEQLCAKGLIKPPCEACDDRLYLGAPPNMQYCMSCSLGRQNARWNGEESLHRLNLNRAKPKPVPRITPEQIARSTAEEMRRKREQLEKLGLL